MSAEQLPRASIDSSSHGTIDSQLKTLKMCARRLQSALSAQAAELQVLQRLYYKNNNQHRGALFWRSVVEIRRLLERMQKLDLLAGVNALRTMFYDRSLVKNINSVKGPWTQCPTEKYLSKYLQSCSESLKLAEKTVERSLYAYESFHRSLQSAAFLHVLLLFVAITSRTRSLAMEIQEALREIMTSVNIIISAMTTIPTETNSMRCNLPAQVEQPMEIEVINDPGLQPIIPNSIDRIPKQPGVSQATHVLSRPGIPPSILSSSTTIQQEDSLPKEHVPTKERSSTTIKKKAKRKAARNEIDDIFGF